MKNIALTQNKCILCKHMIYNINVGCISKVEGLNQFTEKFLLHNQCIYTEAHLGPIKKNFEIRYNEFLNLL